jgi:hypothetical protein
MMTSFARNHYSIITPRFLILMTKILLVAFFVFADSIDATPIRRRSRRRMKSAKSPKSPKIPKYLQLPEVTCLVTGYAITGTSEEQTGDTFDRIEQECSTSTDFDECFLNNYLETAFSAPFQYALDGTDDQLQFTTDEAFIGSGSFQGSIPTTSTDRFDKVILSYTSSPYIEGVNDELWNRPVSDFEYIEYSFKADACGGTATSCPEQFYLNVYTRSDDSITVFYDCRYDFVPTTGGEEDGGWTTVRFDINTVGGTAVFSQSTNGCPDTGPDTLQNAADNNYVLGTNEQYPINTGQIFALNMGDTSLNDAGLIGYFDSIVVKMKDEEPRVFDLEP